MRTLWQAFLRLFFRWLYTSFAWTYDWVAYSVSFGQWRAWGRTALPHIRGGPVLELAHGPGHLLVAMAERELDPIGLDLSPNMGRLAQARLRRSGNADVPLVRAQAQAMPFRAGALGTIVSTFPAEFIAAPETHREIVRLLAPGGRLIVVIGAQLAEKHLASRLLAWLYRVTGQETPSVERVEQFVSTLGLSARIVWEPVGTTRVMVLIADKG